jgi:hypothetical protein
MSIATFISGQPKERRKVLKEINETIIQTDQNIKAGVEPMMGKEMIVYKSSGIFKYGLSSVKNYMSLHAMPIYASYPLYSKYKSLLTNAKFQKGCINFKSETDIPLDILKQLIEDCSKIDLQKIKAEYIRSKRDAQK